MSTLSISILSHFILRTGMYIPSLTKDNAVSFLTGFQAGNKHNFNLIENISKHLENEYNIYGSNLGWPNQIEIYSTNKGLKWISGFKKISLEIFCLKLESNEIVEIQKAIKELIQRIIENIELKDSYPKSLWIDEWLGLVNLQKDWFFKLWSQEELNLIIEMNNEINRMNFIPEEIDDAFNNLLILTNKYKTTYNNI